MSETDFYGAGRNGNGRAARSRTYRGASTESVRARDAENDHLAKPAHKAGAEVYNTTIGPVRPFTTEEMINIRSNVAERMADGSLGDPAAIQFVTESLLDL